MEIEIVDLPSYNMVIFPSVFCMFTRGYQTTNQQIIRSKSHYGTGWILEIQWLKRFRSLSVHSQAPRGC